VKMLVPTAKLALALVVLATLAAGVAVGVALLTAPSLPDAPPTQPAMQPPKNVFGPDHETRPAAENRSSSHAPAQTSDSPLDWVSDRSTIELIGLASATGTLLGFVVATVVVTRTVRRRMRHRRTRVYERFEVRLSAHDEAAPEALAEAVEAIVGVVRERVDVRRREGQPWLAVEFHYAPARAGELEWSMCVVCEPRVVLQLDAALASAYPGIRLGYDFVAEPQPVEGELRRPAHVERLRKHKSFVFALGRGRIDRPGEAAGGAPLVELIAQAQAAAGAPSTVRLTLTPALHAVERLATSLARGEANRAAREERWGATEAGLRAPQRRSELEMTQPSQNRSLCWFELTIGSDDAAACKAITAAVQSLRGGNRLHRRIVDLRPERTRDRFVSGEPPLLPLTPIAGLRTLLSSTEIATLIELPTARMRGVPVRRLMLPRLPAPPDVLRADGALHEPPIDREPFDPEKVVPTNAQESAR